MSEINKREKGLSEKLFLQLMSSKLKLVLNPTLIKKDQSISSEYSGYFILKTDITEVKDIAFVVNGIGFDESSNPGIIQFAGYFSSDPTSQDDYLGINKGSSAISEFGFLWVSDKLDILIKTNSASEISAEIFLQDGSDNKNHCIEIIDVDTLDDFDPTLWNTQEFSGESPVNFSFIIKDKDEHLIVINQNVTSATVVDSILNAHEADVLSNDIEITVNADAEAHPYITGTGIIHTSDAEPTAELDLDIELAQFSLAKVAGSEGGGDDEIGGIKLADQNHLPNTKCFPLKLTQSGQVASGYEQGAYVDLTNFRVDIPASDVHRYSDMDDATEQWSAIGSIVLYIGLTTNDFIHGYYYMRVYEGLLATVGTNTNWYIGNPVSGQTTLNSAISQYNKDNDHLLTTSENVIVTPNLTSDATIVDETEFTLVNGAFVDTITYATLKSWGLALADENYDQDTASLWILTLSIAQDTSNPPIWVQKNVQPMAHMQSALTYKGTCTWAELEIKTPISEPGDFYTVTDKSNQEYFFNGVITSDWEDSWEFMGDVFTLNGKYQIKTKVGSSDPVTVSEFEANQPDTTSITLVQGTNVTLTSDTANHTVEIAAIDTTYTASDFDVKDLADTTGLRTTWTNKQNAITPQNGLEFVTGTSTLLHTNSVTAGTASGSTTKTLTFGDTFDIPTVTYDAQGHVTAKGTTTMTMPANPNTDTQADWNETNTSSAAYINNKPSLATVATSGQYSDLSGAPNLATVATSGAYSDLSGTPTIPTVNNAKLTIKKDSSDTGTEFTANASADVTCNLGLAAVAISGSYADLSNTPSIPAAQIQSDWNLATTTALDYIKNKPSLASVATSGSYTDLSNTPNIPDAIPVGTIQMYAGGSAPTGWLVCDGSAVSRTTYSSLFAVCGTTYGAGDGSTTFNVPNFSGRFALGIGNAGTTYGTTHSIGSSGGDEKVKLSGSESGVGDHSHEILHGGTGTIGYEGVSFTTQSQEYTVGNGAEHNYPIIKSTNVSADATDAHNNMPPYLTINFIIKY